MKKAIFFAIILIVSAAIFSFRSEKKMKAELTVEQWQAVLNVIDHSTAPHTDVKAVQGWLVEQLQAQIDTGKHK